MFKKSFRTLKALLALTLMQAPIIQEANAKGGGSVCESRDSCQRAYNSAMTQAGGVSTAAGLGAGPGMNGGGGSLGGAATATASIACDVARVCGDLKKECDSKKDVCKPKDCEQIASIISKAQVDCTQAGGVAAGAGQTQAATGGGGAGGGMGDMMGPMMMAGMMAMMMMKKDKKKPEPITQDPYAALQLNGQLDCSKYDAFNYQGCNGFMEKKCASQLEEVSCAQFSSRYCSGAQGAPPVANPALGLAVSNPPAGIDPTTGMPMAGPVMGAAGEGIGTGYCQNVMAYNFCKTGGREGCPSCLQLAKNSSPACTLNPNLCLAQNSLGEIEKAKATCPTDPAFSNPNYIAGGGQMAAGGGAPAVILPQSISGSSNGNSQTNSATVSTGSSGTVGSASTSGVTREGQIVVAANSSAGGSGGGSTGSAGFAPALHGNSREIASGTGSNNIQPASLASTEIQPKFGPSLFNTASQIYRNRCQSGRLNCP